MGRREDLLIRIEGMVYPAGYDGEIGGCADVVGFILQREQALLEEIEKPLKNFKEHIFSTGMWCPEENFGDRVIEKALEIIQKNKES